MLKLHKEHSYNKNSKYFKKCYPSKYARLINIEFTKAQQIYRIIKNFPKPIKHSKNCIYYENLGRILTIFELRHHQIHNSHIISNADNFLNWAMFTAGWVLAKLHKAEILYSDFTINNIGYIINKNYTKLVFFDASPTPFYGYIYQFNEYNKYLDLAAFIVSLFKKTYGFNFSLKFWKDGINLAHTFLRSYKLAGGSINPKLLKKATKNICKNLIHNYKSGFRGFCFKIITCIIIQHLAVPKILKYRDGSRSKHL